MKALILAAGEGTRLRPLTLTCPKPMLQVAGVPLIVYIIRWLRWHGVADVAVNLHHLPQVITDYLGDGDRLGIRVSYSYENPILGSAGAAKKLEALFDSTFLVVYGDMLLDVDLAPLLELHRRSKAELTTGLFHAPDPSSVGIVELGSGGRVLRFVEKPRVGEIEGDLAAAGVYLLEPSVLARIPADNYYDFGHDLVPELLQEGAGVYGRLLEGYMLDIGTPEAYAAAQTQVAGLGRRWERVTL